MGDDLESRLKSHARAFEGLMSLIPAEKYYGKDASITSTQWKKTKKQSREERQAAKRAKLDPASHKSAQDVMDENARKRKRELEGDGEDSSDVDMDIEKEKPLEGLKPAKVKKQKTNKASDLDKSSTKEIKAGADDDASASQGNKKADKRKQKLERKKEKAAKKKHDQMAKETREAEFTMDPDSADEVGEDDEDEPVDEDNEDEDENDDDDEEDEDGEDRIQAIDVSGLVEEGQSTATPSATISNASTASVVSAASSSSSSSIPPLSAEDAPLEKKKTPFKPDPKKQEEFRERLTQKLEAMRAARKADGPDGKPAKNRHELIEARRKKEADRKAAKKANRQLAKEDEERLKAEEQLARIRGGSGSPSLFPTRSSPEQERNFAYGKVAWEDGQQLDSNLTGFLESRKKKGRSDAKTALEAAEKKKARLSGLDETKRKDIEEKDLWLTAKKRAQGEKVHDDPSLLKKTLKRQEKIKEKSKQEWKDRLTSVATGKFMKQKKRDENLKKRREEKGSKGKKSKKPGKKVKKRAGFEGTFKGK
ncbi:SURF6-domain-containing protein [Pleomassaria siparia CBS 279.74]|uniref:SURF6-domain-containing protein n=1 Tax=Pleomassaria siparia CBS 279.74 TaxID=1314801 RepID=A0A6G1KGC1_9PLEO|nr:SURF6-domain-containing protein [Pleomassaria siparia CBS 279.74]